MNGTSTQYRGKTEQETPCLRVSTGPVGIIHLRLVFLYHAAKFTHLQLCSAADIAVYPIRSTVNSHIKSLPSASSLGSQNLADAEIAELQTQESFIIQRHAHPGYTIAIPKEATEQPLETYEKSHAYYRTHERLREDFANGMRTSRVCVFDSSTERKMIRKVCAESDLGR